MCSEGDVDRGDWMRKEQGDYLMVGGGMHVEKCVRVCLISTLCGVRVSNGDDGGWMGR